MPWNTRKFLALDIPSITGQGPHSLTVTGEVEVRAANETPYLAEARQGINQHDFVLDLFVSNAGEGGDVVVWKPVSFSKKIENHTYRTVTVHGSTTPLIINVEQAQS